MNEEKRTRISLIASAVTVATISVVYEALGDDKNFDIRLIFPLIISWVWAFFIALLYAVALGLPLYSFLKRRNLIRWWMSIPCGFVIGCSPTAVILYPWHRFPGFNASVNGVAQVADGVTTHAGWISYIETVLNAGALGIAGALAAWFIWQRLLPNQPENRLHPGREVM